MGIFSFIGDIFEEIISWFVDLPEETEEVAGTTVNKASNVAPIPVVYGTRQVVGTRVFVATGGPENKYLYMAIALCEGEIDGVSQVLIDDKPISSYDHVFASGHGASAPGADRLAVVHWYLGRDGQSASALLTAAPGWTAAHRLRGVAYLACRFRYSTEVFRGLPQVKATVRGRKVRDVRDLTAAARYSENSALILYDYLTDSRFGKGLAAADLDTAAFQLAAASCDANENLSGHQMIGSADAVTAAGGRGVIRFDGPRPANLFHAPGTRIYDSASISGSAAVGTVFDVSEVFEEVHDFGGGAGEFADRWRWRGLPGQGRRTEVVYSADKGAFEGGDTLYFRLAGRYNCNVVLDTGKPVMDNVKRLLGGCRGMLPYSAGKYGLLIDCDRPPVMDFGPDNIIGGVSVSGPDKARTYNRVTVKFANPNRAWKEDLAVWPPAGGVVEASLLALDGEPLHHEMAMPTVTNKYQAADLARIVLYKSRNSLRMRFRAMPSGLKATPGSVVAVTDDTLGWTRKLMMVTAVSLDYDGDVLIDGVEHDAAVFDYESLPLDRIHDDTGHANPLAVPALAGLALEVVLDRVEAVRAADAAEGAPPPQILMGLKAAWNAPSDASVSRAEVAWRTKDGAAGWETKRVDGDHTYLLPLRLGETYEVKACFVNGFGALGPWSAVVERIVDKDVTPPGAITDLTLTGGHGMLAVSWTNPADPGYAYAEWELRRFDGDGDIAETISGKYWGDSATVGGLPAETMYDLRMRPVDDAGNGGAWTNRVDATTSTAVQGVDGVDGVDGRGVEYIFTSREIATPVTGAGNLPLASQNYDVDALRAPGGLVRGFQKYYDGTPPDITDDRPYLIRFRRPVSGSPGQNENIGSVGWIQEKSLRVAGFDGPTIEFIYQRKDDPNVPARVRTTVSQDGEDGYIPTGSTNEPQGVTSSARYEFEARRLRGNVRENWGKFSKWTRIDTFINPDTGLPSISVFNGLRPPAQSVGGENDTYVEIGAGPSERFGVYKKLNGKWVRVSGNPDNAAWTAGEGEPSAAAANGSYYGDRSTAIVWVRHAGAWHQVIDLDPSGAVAWRFGAGAPAANLGANGDRYYRWSNGVWYEKSGGNYAQRGDLTTGYHPSTRNTKPAPVDFRARVDGTSVTLSWALPVAASYNNQGAPRPLLVLCGGIKTAAAAWGTTEAIAPPGLSSFTFTDLLPNTNYNARICARYDNGGGDILLAAISAYATLDFRTGSRTVEANSALGDAATFVNSSGTAGRVELAGAANLVTLKAGAAETQVLRIEKDGDLRSQGELFAADLSASSDRRLKDNLARIDRALDKVGKLTGYTFRKKGRPSAGLIAQDVRDVLPEAVSESDEFLSLSPAAVLGLLVEAIKELREAVHGPADKR